MGNKMYFLFILRQKTHTECILAIPSIHFPPLSAYIYPFSTSGGVASERRITTPVYSSSNTPQLHLPIMQQCRKLRKTHISPQPRLLRNLEPILLCHSHTTYSIQTISNNTFRTTHPHSFDSSSSIICVSPHP